MRKKDMKVCYMNIFLKPFMSPPNVHRPNKVHRACAVLPDSMAKDSFCKHFTNVTCQCFSEVNIILKIL